MKILAIESSCDETAAAVVEDGVRELCSVVATSKELHEATGGVVPEVAARKQVESIVPVVDECLRRLGKALGVEPQADQQEIGRQHIDAIAVTIGPGLIGSLVVGVEAAKTLAWAWGKPLIPVNHLVGHLYANFLIDAASKRIPLSTKLITFPAVGLLVSGGHTDLILMRDHGKFEYIGGTLDDAAGECFDKTARMLGLAKYLGGVLVSNEAQKFKDSQASGVKSRHLFPRPLIGSGDFEFSFSGLKTAVSRFVTGEDFAKYSVGEVCYELECAIVDVLAAKTMKAVEKFGAGCLVVGGGVSANGALRVKLAEMCEKAGVTLCIPPVRLCTDNAVYIASAAFFNQNGIVSGKDIAGVHANPSLGIMDGSY